MPAAPQNTRTGPAANLTDAIETEVMSGRVGGARQKLVKFRVVEKVSRFLFTLIQKA